MSNSIQNFVSLPFVEEAFQQFGLNGGLRELFMVGDAIAFGAQSLELTDQERHAVEAEVAALTFHGNPRVKSCWNTYFRPRSSEEQADGSVIHCPDIRQLDVASIQRWKQRVEITNDPVVRARFADAIWDLEQAITGGGARPFEFAKIAVNAYLQGVSEQRFGVPIASTFPLHRALMVASQLNDSDLIRTVSTKILELGESAPLTSIGIWSMPSSTFLGIRHMPADLTSWMLDQLQGRLADASAASNEYACHVAGSSLLKCLKERSERQRVVRVVGEVHRRNAEQWTSLRAIGLLRSIAILYEQEALPEEAKALHLYIEQRGESAHLEMKSFEYTISLDKQETEKLINRLLVGTDAYPALFRLASACLPDPDALRKLITESKEESLLSRMIPRSYIGNNGLPSSQIGTPDDDPGGNLVELFRKDLEVKMIYLVIGIRAAREKFKVTPSELIDEMLVGSPLFREDRRVFFEQGFEAYEHGDYMKAVHVLVPQVETMMRELLGVLGVAKTKPNPAQPHLFEHKNMNDFFREPEVIESVEENLYLFLKSLYIDKRSGFNLRNDLAHGLVEIGDCSEQTASLIIQSIILLSMPNPTEVYVSREEASELAD
jgi:lysyl-tRNA synthetase class 1